MVAGAGAGGEFADEAGGRAAGVGLLFEAGVGFGFGGFDRGLGAVGDALEGGGEAGRGGDVEGAEVLFAVFAGEVQREGGVGGGGVGGDGGLEAGVEGAGAVGAGGAVRAFVDVEELARGLGGEGGVPGGRRRLVTS